MESQVLTPAPGQTIVATETNHHRRHDGHHDHDSWLREQMRAGFTAEALANCKTDNAVATAFAASQKQVSDAATSTLVGFKDLTALSYQVEGRGLLEAAKNASLLGIQADKNFYALTVEAVKNASAAQLEAQKNASAIAAQVAECCCELKGIVVAQSVQTRDLISANTLQDQRDRAAKAEAQLASLFARNIAPVVPGAV